MARIIQVLVLCVSVIVAKSHVIPLEHGHVDHMEHMDPAMLLSSGHFIPIITIPLPDKLGHLSPIEEYFHHLFKPHGEHPHKEELINPFLPIHHAEVTTAPATEHIPPPPPMLSPERLPSASEVPEVVTPLEIPDMKINKVSVRVADDHIENPLVYYFHELFKPSSEKKPDDAPLKNPFESIIVAAQPPLELAPEAVTMSVATELPSVANMPLIDAEPIPAVMIPEKQDVAVIPITNKPIPDDIEMDKHRKIAVIKPKTPLTNDLKVGGLVPKHDISEIKEGQALLITPKVKREANNQNVSMSNNKINNDAIVFPTEKNKLPDVTTKIVEVTTTTESIVKDKVDMPILNKNHDLLNPTYAVVEPNNNAVNNHVLSQDNSNFNQGPAYGNNGQNLASYQNENYQVPNQNQIPLSYQNVNTIPQNQQQSGFMPNYGGNNYNPQYATQLAATPQQNVNYQIPNSMNQMPLNYPQMNTLPQNQMNLVHVNNVPNLGNNNQQMSGSNYPNNVGYQATSPTIYNLIPINNPPNNFNYNQPNQIGFNQQNGYIPLNQGNLFSQNQNPNNLYLNNGQNSVPMNNFNMQPNQVSYVGQPGNFVSLNNQPNNMMPYNNGGNFLQPNRQPVTNVVSVGNQPQNVLSVSSTPYNIVAYNNPGNNSVPSLNDLSSNVIASYNNPGNNLVAISNPSNNIVAVNNPNNNILLHNNGNVPVLVQQANVSGGGNPVYAMKEKVDVDTKTKKN